MIKLKPKYVMRTGAVITILIITFVMFMSLVRASNGRSNIDLTNYRSVIALALFVLPVLLYGIWEWLRRKNKKKAVVAILFWLSFIVLCSMMYMVAEFSTWEGIDIDTAPAKPGIERRIKTTILMSLFPVSIALSGLYVASEVIDKRRKK